MIKLLLGKSEALYIIRYAHTAVDVAIATVSALRINLRYYSKPLQGLKVLNWVLRVYGVIKILFVRILLYLISILP